MTLKTDNGARLCSCIPLPQPADLNSLVWRCDQCNGIIPTWLFEFSPDEPENPYIDLLMRSPISSADLRDK
jgi:hypothetical protein